METCLQSTRSKGATTSGTPAIDILAVTDGLVKTFVCRLSWRHTGIQGRASGHGDAGPCISPTSTGLLVTDTQFGVPTMVGLNRSTQRYEVGVAAVLMA